MPSSIIAFICGEKQTNLKHQQLISGMSLGAYWTLNYTFDMLRAIWLVGAAIILIYVNKLGLQDIWIALAVYPFAIVPFTYVCSFLFDKEGTA
jgi:ATP-binding cassette subfamily A (ABC1) protein 3